MGFEALDIVGVVAADVGTPKNDGSPGSGLYEVPIELSRSLTTDEERLLIQIWDHPPRFSTMHRPGTARIDSARFVLTATTVDEVKQHHAATLRSVVDRFNLDMADVQRRREEQQQARSAEDQAHRQHVDDVASDIKFD